MLRILAFYTNFAGTNHFSSGAVIHILTIMAKRCWRSLFENPGRIPLSFCEAWRSNQSGDFPQVGTGGRWRIAAEGIQEKQLQNTVEADKYVKGRWMSA